MKFLAKLRTLFLNATPERSQNLQSAPKGSAPSDVPSDLLDKARGALWGAIIGDALGVPVEFQERLRRDADPVREMRQGGRWRQSAGTWSDDSALMLASAEAVVDGYSSVLMAEYFRDWFCEGRWAVERLVFDVGSTTRNALLRVPRCGNPEDAGGSDVSENGNGSLMRILPVALRFLGRPNAEIFDTASRASSITHAHERSRIACGLYCLIVEGVLRGSALPDAIAKARIFIEESNSYPAELSLFVRALDPSFAEVPRECINSGGYVIDSFEAALWCVLTTDSFKEAVLKAVNLGDDTDTTACVAGGLAGALYGYGSIPNEWLGKLRNAKVAARTIERFLPAVGK